MDRPIIFSAPMVRALLDGRKTQTRRVLSRQNTFRDGRPWSESRHAPWSDHDWNDVVVDPGPSPAGNAGPYLKVAYPAQETRHRIYPAWSRGDRLWVREAHMFVGGGDPGNPIYRANWREDAIARHMQNLQADEPKGWRPSIHMPRWASRLTLAVTEVRVERLQGISEEDILAEGVDPFASEIVSFFERYEQAENGGGRCVESREVRTRRPAFQRLWNSINGPDAWDANPWVAAISFTVHRANIDALDIGAAA